MDLRGFDLTRRIINPKFNLLRYGAQYNYVIFNYIFLHTSRVTYRKTIAD
jgi:hypothetical protein